MKALLIVDLQNDFLPGGALGVPQGDEIIEPINRFQEKFHMVVATKDWHPPNHISFASHHGKEPGETVKLPAYEQELWPDHCVRNTFGSAFSPRLNTRKIAHVFYKGIDDKVDSYSAFFDNVRKRETGLAAYLKDHRVEELYIVGLATDFCVKFSVLDALELGFKVYVIEEGCRAIGSSEEAFDVMRRAGATILPTLD